MALPFHQHLFPRVKKLLGEYKMLAEGDRIAVGVSGGKDSLVALYALALLRGHLPVDYNLIALSVDMGWPDSDWSLVSQYCAHLNLAHHVIETQIGPLLFDVRKETNPCSLCSKLRHGALNSAAGNLGCNVVALGHHREDAIETLFLNMMYNGRLACFQPVTQLDRSGLKLIRPLLYVSEKTTRLVAAKLPLPVIHNPCPANGYTKRQQVKEMLAEQSQTDPRIPGRLLTALGQLWQSGGNLCHKV